MRLPLVTTPVSAPLKEQIMSLRDRIKTTSEEAVTGRRSDLTSHLNGRIGKAMLSNKALSEVNAVRQQLDLRQNRLDLMQNTFEVIGKATANLDTRLLAGLGGDNLVEVGLAAQDAASALQQVISALNVRHGERFLFSGDATATTPFGDHETLISEINAMATAATSIPDFETALDSYFNDPTGPWQQGFYAGAPTASDPDAIVGSHPGITKLVSALAIIAQAQPETVPAIMQGDKTILSDAATALADGRSALRDLQVDTGIIQERISIKRENLDKEETILANLFNTLTARDQFEAAAELRELETSLEASYLLTTRISNLSLLNYLR